MKKRLSFFLFVLMFFSAFGQKDTRHWFGPMFDTQNLFPSGTTSSSTNYLFLSTESPAPFDVSIYNGTTLLGTVNISNGNPNTFQVPNQYLVTNSTGSTMTAVTMGLYLEAPEDFFASLRQYNSAHGETITAKGTAALGKKFYSVNTPVYSSNSLCNFTTSVLATEDNTEITVSGYNNGIIFTNGTTAASTPTLTITLDKNESYIIAGQASNQFNATGFIGAKIESTKPILVTNGNLNGQYDPNGTGSDIVMDQSVPVDVLGDEFAMVKGNGSPTGGMEGVIVVATEDNTNVYVNNAVNPITTLNEGQWYIIPGSNYVLQGPDHYNLYLKSSKNVYVYQLLGGDFSQRNTNGFNYIPPLNCYLPRKIDEIPLVNQIKPAAAGNPNITVKLNIITEAGATVTINGVTPPATQGPFLLSGTTNWVTYSVPDASGNYTIQSNKAVTAGINGGYSTAGYGGFYAGFSSVPQIDDTGSCIPGKSLEVQDYYETYQWYFNDNPIPGANTNALDPTLPGVYSVVVGIGGCIPVETKDFPVYPCTKQTTVDAIVCNSKTFTPAFSVSPQNIDYSTLEITTQPANGTVTIDPNTGEITYVPTANFQGNDTFTYMFYGDIGEFADSEEVKVNVKVVKLETFDATIGGCQYEGVGTFNLTTPVLTNFTDVTYAYYATENDLINGTNAIQNITAYESTEGVVYVMVTTKEGCQKAAKIYLTFLESPEVFDAELTSCFIEEDPTQTHGVFDLNIATVTNDAPVVKQYYLTLTDLLNGVNEITYNNSGLYVSESGEVFVKVSNNQGCFSIAKIKLTVFLPEYSSTLVDQTICFEDRTTLDAGPGYTSYEWSTGALSQTINVGVGEYWVELRSKNNCTTIQKVKVMKSDEPIISKIDIENTQAVVSVVGGTPPYQYSTDGINWQDSNVFEGLSRGQHTFYVKDSYNCEPISTEVTVPNLLNTITPNGDNVNDYVDYSELAFKRNLEMKIYDRYGNLVHTANRNNGFRWDGKVSGREIVTDTYWYHISWTEPTPEGTQVKYSGWILVKNRE